MGILDKLNKPKAQEKRDEEPLPTPKKNYAMWHVPKAHPALQATADAKDSPLPSGRPGSLIEHLRQITDNGKSLVDNAAAVERGEPFPSEIIQDEFGRPRLNEKQEVCYKWSLPSLRARAEAREWLSKRGVAIAAPTQALVAHTTIRDHTENDLSGLSIEEQRKYLELDFKNRAAKRARGVQEKEVDGETLAIVIDSKDSH